MKHFIKKKIKHIKDSIFFSRFRTTLLLLIVLLFLFNFNTDSFVARGQLVSVQGEGIVGYLVKWINPPSCESGFYWDGTTCATVVNGDCGATPTHYTCATGNSTNPAENSNSYTWSCVALILVPFNLSATPASNVQINLDWINTDYGAQTRIYRGGSLVATVAAGVTTYNDTGLSAGVSYSYTVRHYANSFESTDSNTATVSTLPAPVISAFDVQPRTTTGSVTATFTATDAGGSHLQKATLMRATARTTCTVSDDSGCNDWAIVSTLTAPSAVDTWNSGSTPPSSILYTPPVGSYIFGLQVYNNFNYIGYEPVRIRVDKS